MQIPQHLLSINLTELRYKSVSFYTVKVLEEVLRLRDHYVALRRYFFMETADWADNFVAALCDHVSSR